MITEIKQILEAGIKAPSGSNSQPWRFKIDQDKLYVLAEYQKDHPILNYRNRGTLIAHGALLENISIASRHYGYTANVEQFPEQGNSKVLASITFDRSENTDSPLFDCIDKRATNRKPYKKRTLTTSEKDDLLQFAGEFPNLETKFEENTDKIRILADASSINEVVMLEDKQLHNLFYNEITWNEKEDDQRRMGFFLKTLEMNFGQRSALRIFKNWNVIDFFNKLGAAKGIAKSNAGLYASVGAIGVIVVNDNDSEFLDAGRLMEKLWLQATKMGLGFHLVTGVLYLWQRIQDPSYKEISDIHRKLIKDAYQSIAKIFNVPENKRIAILFRIGAAEAPSARSKRIELEKLIEK